GIGRPRNPVAGEKRVFEVVEQHRSFRLDFRIGAPTGSGTLHDGRPVAQMRGYAPDSNTEPMVFRRSRKWILDRQVSVNGQNIPRVNGRSCQEISQLD